MRKRPILEEVISPRQAEILRAQGWQAADLHVHTNRSEGVLPSTLLDPLYLYEKAKDAGMDYITFTDHDTMEAYDVVGWTREKLVPGVEIKIKDVCRVGHSLHINVYCLNNRQFTELLAIARKKRNLETFLQYLKSENLPYVYNHPFWYEHGEKPSYRVINDLIPLFPIVEYNMHRVWQKNALTLKLAQRYNRGILAATDTHIGEIGRAFTLAQGETFREYFEAIARREAYLVPQDLTLDLLKDEILTWINLINNLDVVRLEKVAYLHIKPVDSLINFYVKGALIDYPALRKASMAFFSTLARSGAPALFYLEIQHFLVYRMNRQLRLADVL
ncbi:MAG: PHP domain-containing protein [Candidatus Omnitrophica bacterium]|nr:PHP domain-containing protein [Candidatus Omnitrophota bacterium]